jgi:hypothetical protein
MAIRPVEADEVLPAGSLPEHLELLGIVIHIDPRIVAPGIPIERILPAIIESFDDDLHSCQGPEMLRKRLDGGHERIEVDAYLLTGIIDSLDRLHFEI